MKSEQTSLVAVSKIVKRYLRFFKDDYINNYIKDKENDITEETEALVEKESDLLIQSLMKEIWKLNEDRIREELIKKNNEILNLEKEKLKKEHVKSEKLNGFKNIMSLVGDSIIIGSLIGIGVNQITENISSIKTVISEATNTPVWVITLSITILIILLIIIIISKRFMENFGDVIRTIFNNENN